MGKYLGLFSSSLFSLLSKIYVELTLPDQAEIHTFSQLSISVEPKTPVNSGKKIEPACPRGARDKSAGRSARNLKGALASALVSLVMLVFCAVAPSPQQPDLGLRRPSWAIRGLKMGMLVIRLDRCPGFRDKLTICLGRCPGYKDKAQR